jgi:hypothetical protein
MAFNSACAGSIVIPGFSGGGARRIRRSYPVEDPLPTLYRPLAQDERIGVVGAITLPVLLVARTESRAAAIAGSIRREVAALAPEVQFVEVRPMAELLQPKLQPWSIATLIFGLFGGVAFLLAAVGPEATSLPDNGLSAVISGALNLA